MSTTFESLQLHPALVERLASYGIVEPSAIQRESIPAALEGKDVMAQSQTGTGKTLAYLLPILQRINPDSKALQAVIIAPTRELGIQIVGEIERYGAALGIRGQAVIGGAAISRQIEKLKQHPHIVVGTPGRIWELIKLRKLKMHEVRTIVADEADQLVDLGTIEDVKHILKSALRDRQLLFFSATLNPEVQRIANRWMNDPVKVEIEPAHRTSPTIEHSYVVCEPRDKVDMLRRVFHASKPKSAIVFVNEIEPIAELVAKLDYSGIPTAALYGDAPKQERTKVLGRFRDGGTRLLVATDVAARGLDIADVTHIFHLDPAPDAEHYVHRVGRTGRMGKPGTTISIVSDRELFILRKFEQELGIRIEPRHLFEGKLLTPEQAKRAFSRRRPATPPPRTKAAPEERKKRNDRERDRKNKGAPKWLKAKRESGTPRKP
jgi:ATP-dependent RNA helicase DeaD